MEFNVLPSSNPKRRRIMIITADEDFIDQIEKTNDAALLKQIMIESKVDNSTKDDQQMQIKLPEQKNKTNREPLTCIICGSPAHGYNFGVISCESCKAFFRRSALKTSNIFQCRNKRDCQITTETRRDCPACRLAKCLNCGMKRDRLSANEQKAVKLCKIAENQNLPSCSTSKINEQQYEPSSSIVSSDSGLSVDPDTLFLTKFSDILPSYSDQVSLSPDDLQRVQDISLFYEKRIELAAGEHYLCTPSQETSSFLQKFNSQSVIGVRLLSFFKQIPEFSQLNIEDKVTLVKYNIMIVASISSGLLYNTETRQIIVTDSEPPVDYESYGLVYGYNICKKAKKIFDSFVYLANYDRKIIELSLVIFILTKGISSFDAREPILNDTMAVSRAQNCYIELLWKYMEAIHGHKVAVRLFSQLIVGVISWQTIQGEMRDSIMRVFSPNDVDELLPIIKAVLDIQ